MLSKISMLTQEASGAKTGMLQVERTMKEGP